MGQRPEKSSKTIGNEEIVLLRLSEVRSEGRPSSPDSSASVDLRLDFTRRLLLLAEAFFFEVDGEQNFHIDEAIRKCK